MISELLNIVENGGTLPSSEPFYRRCLKDIEEMAVAPQIYSVLRSSGLWEKTPDFFQRQIESQKQSVLGQNLFVLHHESQLLKQFEDASVPVIPLKGVRFAERYYGHVGARPSSDIDLLVRPENVEQAIECIRSLGFEGPEDYNPRHYHCNLWKRTEGPYPCMVELHWNIIKEYTSNLQIEELWQAAKPSSGSSYVYEMSTNYQFYSICLHGANHGLDSVKHTLDVRQMILHCGEKINYTWLFYQAKKDKTLRRVHMVLMEVYRQFPKLEKTKPLTAFTKAAGFNKKFSWGTYDTFTHRALVVKDWLWPKRSVAVWFLRIEKDTPYWKIYALWYGRRLKKLARMAVGMNVGTDG